MMLHKYLATVALAICSAAALGETGADNSTTPTTTDGEITIHTVTVGKVLNQFEPNSILANPGDIISFVFYAGNHSVIHSAYGYPCEPIEDVENNTQPFFSQFQPVADGTTSNVWASITYTVLCFANSGTSILCGI
jgi:plastocyanin